MQSKLLLLATLLLLGACRAPAPKPFGPRLDRLDAELQLLTAEAEDVEPEPDRILLLRRLSTATEALLAARLSVSMYELDPSSEEAAPIDAALVRLSEAFAELRAELDGEQDVGESELHSPASPPGSY